MQKKTEYIFAERILAVYVDEEGRYVFGIPRIAIG